MNFKSLTLLLALCFYGGMSARAEDDPGGQERNTQLQASFQKFPLLPMMTNGEGHPVFQELPGREPILQISGKNYYGFRFTVPPRSNHEDLVWAFVPAPGAYTWYILPEKGSMSGFYEFWASAKDFYPDTDQLLPLHQDALILQSLPGDYLEDGQTYLIWEAFDTKPKAWSVAFTFSHLDPQEMDTERAFERALGLKCISVDKPLSDPVLNTNNQHTYILLRAATRDEAEAKAVALGGHLATVRNQTEEDWIYNTFGKFNGKQRLLWIGLSEGNKQSHFSWSSGESVSYTSWVNNGPKNRTDEDEERPVAIYYPNHKQHNKWAVWDRYTTHDPIGLAMLGVVEIIPPQSTVNLVNEMWTAQIEAPMIVSNTAGTIKLEWPLAATNCTLECSTNATGKFLKFGYSEHTNEQAGVIFTIVSNASPQIFFRLRKSPTIPLN